MTSNATENSPFEWLTSFESLSHLLDPKFLFDDPENLAPHGSLAPPSPPPSPPTSPQTPLHVLHVGCGTSRLAEDMLHHFPRYQTITSVDSNEEDICFHHSLAAKTQTPVNDTHTHESPSPPHEHQQERRSEYRVVDLSITPGRLPSHFYDVVVDKGTLDCALCCDEFAPGLICEVHRTLKRGPQGGVLVLVTFHSVEYIVPLLRDCPGTDWKDIQVCVVQRCKDPPNGDPSQKEELDELKRSSVGPWSSGTFRPTSDYNSTVNVILLRTGGPSASASSTTPSLLDRELVAEHIRSSNDDWFQRQNPMVTPTRETDIRAAFTRACQKRTHDDANRERVDPTSPTVSLPLAECYQVLFNDEERSYLTLDFFTQDWEAFCRTDNETTGSASDTQSSRLEGCGYPETEVPGCMTVDTAIAFLTEMQ